MCGKVLVWLPMKRMISLILQLILLVFRRYEFLVVFGHTLFSSFQIGAGLG